MTTAITRDDLLAAYERGKRAGYDAAKEGTLLYDQEQDPDELTLAEVLERFDLAGPSDILKLGVLNPTEVLQTLLDAVDRGQYIFRVNYPDGWVANVLTTHGTAAVTASAKGSLSFHTVAPPIAKGTLDIGQQVRETQAKQLEANQGYRTVTGAQYGRWFL
jgi:hypothetical protein